eukprot:scaffold3777_cov214-Alexandrium_tamarense.AAC.24
MMNESLSLSQQMSHTTYPTHRYDIRSKAVVSSCFATRLCLSVLASSSLLYPEGGDLQIVGLFLYS